MKTIKSKINETFKKSAYLNSCVTVFSYKEIKIENATKIIDCNDIYIKIRTTDCDVIIWGEGLKCSSYNNDIISIKGFIRTIEFEAKR